MKCRHCGSPLEPDAMDGPIFTCGSYSMIGVEGRSQHCMSLEIEQLYDKLAESQAEIKRLKSEASSNSVILTASKLSYQIAEHENKKMRKALSKIARMSPYIEVTDIARKALETSQPDSVATKASVSNLVDHPGGATPEDYRGKG